MLNKESISGESSGRELVYKFDEKVSQSLKYD